MECPNCGIEISDINQIFCETCGFELNSEIINNKESVKEEKSLKTSRRRCC